MFTQAWGLAARPAVAEFGDKYVDLSTAKKYVYTQGGWSEEGGAPSTEEYLRVQ